MSGNPIGVWKSPHSTNWFWQHPDCDPDWQEWGLSWGSELTAGDAADAGREHMRQAHPQPMTPLVQTIVNSTRCTCGDLPDQSFPWFRPCPVHSYLVNPTKADLDATWVAGGNVYQAADGAKSTYCRPHGCARTECGCIAENRGISTNLRYNENAPEGAGNTLRGLTHSSDYGREGLT